MAMTDLALVLVIAPPTSDWKCKSLYNADVTGCEDLLAAVAGKSHYIRKIIISCGTDSATISLGAGETTGALTQSHLGPITFSASTAHPFVMDFNEKSMKIAVGTAFCIDGVTAAPVWIYFEYKTA